MQPNHYVIRKYVKAHSAADALKKEKRIFDNDFQVPARDDENVGRLTSIVAGELD